MKLTSDQIKERIKKLESFWVGSEPERKVAIATASTLEITYHTRADYGGGFYVYYLPPMPKHRNT